MASIYDENLMTKSDYERILRLNKAWEEADSKQKKDSLHNQAEAIRNSYGYSGGGDGSQFIAQNADAVNVAAASGAYADALRAAEAERQKAFDAQKQDIQKDGADRLREAYIKNMRSQLGLEQALKAEGISGGMSESTRAALENNYNTQRNNIKQSTADSLRDIGIEASKSKADSDVNVAKADKESVSERADILQKYEQKNYDRAQDALDREFAKMQFDYQKQLDEYNQQYQKQKDEYNRQYQKQKDESDRAYEKERDEKDRELRQKQIQLSANKTSSGSSSASNSIQQQNVKTAWSLLNKGVYYDGLDEILGLPEEVLKKYAENVLNGY